MISYRIIIFAKFIYKWSKKYLYSNVKKLNIKTKWIKDKLIITNHKNKYYKLLYIKITKISDTICINFLNLIFTFYEFIIHLTITNVVDNAIVEIVCMAD